MQIGNYCSIYNSIGDFGTEPYLIKIGDNTTITSGVKFVTHDGPSRLFRNKIKYSKYGECFNPIIVGSNVFIGLNTIILPGTKIEDNVIVGAGSVITRNLTSNKIYAGNPAKEISSLENYILKYKDCKLSLKSTNRNSLKKELLGIFKKELS